MSKEKKEKTKGLRLQPLMNIDLCACGTLNHFRCSGICREKHKNEHGEIVCGEKYRIEVRTKYQKKRKNKNNEDNVSKHDPRSKRSRRFSGRNE